MFATGATPSRLIQFIADHFPADANWPSYVQACFASAFSTVVLDMENHPSDQPVDDKKAADLNTRVLHEIVGRVPLWRDSVASQDRLWFDGLSISSDELSLIDSVHPESHPSLAESWPKMNEEAREFIRRTMVNSQSYYEKTQILARLVEKLQQQVGDHEPPSDAHDKAEASLPV
jgi:hypothetical protein